MTDAPDHRFDTWGDWDSYHHEYEKFQEDAHTLILWPLHAAISNLKQEAEAEDAKLEPRLSLSKGEEAEHYANLQQQNWQYINDQERFLRNVALVALMSRLTHAILSMFRHAEPWAERNPKGYEGKDEFKKIWSEFRVRFGLNLNARDIKWVESYRCARNRIVHNGGEANVLKPFAVMDNDAGDVGMYYLSFSKKYPAFVMGEGYNAEVVITEKLLDHAVEAAIRLVAHAAEELRKLELADAKLKRESDSHAPELANNEEQLRQRD
jgi:hypothetical protein